MRFKNYRLSILVAFNLIFLIQSLASYNFKDVMVTENPSDLTTTEQSVFLIQKQPSRRCALIIHGLNLPPSKMNDWTLAYFSRGYDVYRLSLTGHQGEYNVFKEATAHQWTEDFKRAYQQIKQYNSFCQVEVLGYSIGALVSLVHYNNPELNISKETYLAPALALTRLASWVKYFFTWDISSLPSWSYPEYGLYKKVPIKAYKALFDLQASEAIRSLELEARSPSKRSITIYMSPRDELVQYRKVSALAERQGWAFYKLEPKGFNLKWKAHHQIMDRPSLGPEGWNMLINQVIVTEK